LPKSGKLWTQGGLLPTGQQLFSICHGTQTRHVECALSLSLSVLLSRCPFLLFTFPSDLPFWAKRTREKNLPKPGIEALIAGWLMSV
jgi:hypothetical protein